MCNIRISTIILLISQLLLSSVLLASPPERIFEFKVETLKLGTKYNEVVDLFKNDNRWERVKISKARKGRSPGSARATINTDDGASCALNIRFTRPEHLKFKSSKEREAYNKKLKNTIPNPPIYGIHMQCTYNPALEYKKHLEAVAKRFGKPDYKSKDNAYTSAQVYIGTNEYSSYIGSEDLRKKCAEIIQEKGKAGTNSKALSMANTAISRILSIENIDLIENKKHPLLDVCPEIGNDYLTLLKELYAPLLVYQVVGKQERGINSTTLTLINSTNSGQTMPPAVFNKNKLILVNPEEIQDKTSEENTKNNTSKSNSNEEDVSLKVALTSMGCNYKEEDILMLKNVLK